VRLALGGLAALALLLAAGTATATAKPTALMAFLAPAVEPSATAESDAFEAELASVPQLSTGILSATQGAYTAAQMALDIGQGTRVSSSAYSSPTPPALSLTANGQVRPWNVVLDRAHSAPQLLQPGLLAARIPGRGAYAGVDGQSRLDGATAAIAADGNGLVAAVSLGGAATLVQRIESLRASHRLIVADLLPGAPGLAQLRALATRRPSGELLIVVQRVPQGHGGASAGQVGGDSTLASQIGSDSMPAGQAGRELLWVAFAGLGPGGRTLTSQTTDQRGLVAAIDIAPTILRHLGLGVPAAMRGKPVRLDGRLEGAGLRSLKARLGVISSRRLPALGWLLIAWALLFGAAWLSRQARRGHRLSRQARSGRGPSQSAQRGQRPNRRGPGRRSEAWSLRVGALALLWTPVAALLTAALSPSRTLEFVLLIAICFALGALSDRLLRWPRAPIAPALTAVVAITVDALAGTQLLIRSLLGPNPAFGARFYGIGNELKSGLAVLVLCAVAAALYPAARGRRAALAMAGAGTLLAVVEGSARIGAAVGGVILVSAGTAVATVMLLPGAPTRRRILLAMAAPVAGLAALAALDLATAHGSGHFTGSVLHARSAGDLRDILVRRYGAAWDELKNHLMPLATALALVAAIAGIARRERLCAPVAADPAWLAALGGGLTAGAVGALTEDSGPVLLVVGVFALACVLAYLWGRPPQPQSAGVDELEGAVAAGPSQHDLVL
jgi:hypothetical protein